MAQSKQTKKMNNAKSILEKHQKDYLIKQAKAAIKQLKQHEQLSLNDFREAEILFENSDEINKYLDQKNQQKKREKLSKEPKIKKRNIYKQRKLQNKKTKEKGRPKQSQEEKQNLNMMEQQDKEKVVAKYPKVVFDFTRKWNEVLQNPKKGKYEPEEIKLLHTAMLKYLNQNNLDMELLVNYVDKQDYQKIPGNLKLWTAVCSVLPNRPLKSSYKYLMRSLNSSNKKKEWTEIEENELLRLYISHGSKWKTIAQQLGRTPEIVRDKYRNLSKKHSKSGKSSYWKIEQLINFFQEIQRMTGINFLRQGISKLQEEADKHNKKEEEVRQSYKYNSKYFILPNNIEIMQFINSEKFGQVDRNKIRWKEISDKIGSRSEAECKNKYNQFMEIFNRDYSGENEEKVIKFIQKQMKKGNGINQADIEWQRWDQNINDLKAEEAKSLWRNLKKKISNKCNQTLKQILADAKIANERKRAKYKIHFQKQNQKVNKK